MSSISAQLPPAPSPEPVFRLSVDQYHAMIDAGVLSDDDPVELLEGILVFKMPKKPKHRIALAKLRRALEPLLPRDHSLQTQEPITLADGEPEPDGAVIRGAPEDYPTGHPAPADVLLVIEISDGTLRRDRGVKLRSYARAGILTYWVIDLVGRSISIYTAPDTKPAESSYRQTRTFDESANVPVEIDGRVIGEIAVAALLP